MIPGHETGALLGELKKRNRKPSRLLLASSPANGYVIDYDGTFAKYFDRDQGGWEKWYKDNPLAHGYTQVSLPAYDDGTGLVLIYVGTQTHRLAGAGYLLLYQLDHDRLDELARVMLWIS